MNYNKFFLLALNETAWYQTILIIVTKGIHQNQGSFLLVKNSDISCLRNAEF